MGEQEKLKIARIKQLEKQVELLCKSNMIKETATKLLYLLQDYLKLEKSFQRNRQFFLIKKKE